MVPLLLIVCAVVRLEQTGLASALGVDTIQPYSRLTRALLAETSPCDDVDCNSSSGRALVNLDTGGDDDDDQPRAPPNPILAATPVPEEQGLVQFGAVGTITVVKTAAQMYAALAAGSRHIDLRDHIDLTQLQIDTDVEWSEPLLPEVLQATVSITVRSDQSCCVGCSTVLECSVSYVSYVVQNHVQMPACERVWLREDAASKHLVLATWCNMVLIRDRNEN
jgi:hypothetical protein